MKEFVEKLMGSLEEYEYSHLIEHDSEECLHCQENEDDCCGFRNCFVCVWDKAKEIVNQLAEEYKNESVKGDLISRSALIEKFDTDFAEGLIDCFDDVIGIVEEAPTAYNDGWIPCSKQLPPHSDDLLLIQCSGKPKNNIVFNNAFCLASYTKEGWLLELYPEWKGAEVIAWMPLPEPFREKEGRE